MGIGIRTILVEKRVHDENPVAQSENNNDENPAAQSENDYDEDSEIYSVAYFIF